MNNRDLMEAQQYFERLSDMLAKSWGLPGVSDEDKRGCLSQQIVDSLRRIRYAHFIRDRRLSTQCSVPYSGCFDPLRAAVIQCRAGDYDDAWWLVFLATHFGKHHEDGWALTESVYGALNEQKPWNWNEVIKNRANHLNWLRVHHAELSKFRFSNHRKYRTNNPNSDRGTPAVIESYLNWLEEYGSHSELVRGAHRVVGQNPKETFGYIYNSMRPVKQFGRLGRFDFLTMIGKLGIAPVEPDSAYLKDNATGPLAGANLLFAGAKDAATPVKVLEEKLHALEAELGVGFQVLEDALCNWQKSPDKYERFRG